MIEIDEGKKRVEKIKSCAQKNGISLQVILLIATIILTMILSVILNYFTGNISFDILSSVGYWVKQAGTAFTTFLLFILTRQTYKLIEENKNEDYKRYRLTIAKYYDLIERENKFEDFHRYLIEENHRRKLSVYKDSLNRKILAKRFALDKLPEKAKVRRAKMERDIERWNVLLSKAEENVDYVRVKYSRVTYSLIFGVENRNGETDEDFATHEGPAIATKAVFKLLWVFAFGLLFGLLGSSLTANDQPLTIILNVTVMLMQFLVSIFFGGIDGQSFVRGTINDKLRLRCGFIARFCGENWIYGENQKMGEETV